MFACAERGRLLRDWRDAVTILADCIEQTETSNLTGFEERFEAMLQARQIAETRHTVLMLHRKKHHC
jgi:hypothetical protein